jgi:hypothetical protein
MSMNWPASRWRRMALNQSPVAGGATGTSVGGSATVVAALAPALPRVERRLAGLSAGVAEAEGRLRLKLESAAAALRVDMTGLAAKPLPCFCERLSALTALNRSGRNAGNAGQ